MIIINFLTINKVLSKLQCFCLRIRNRALIKKFKQFGEYSTLRTINSLTGTENISVGENVHFCEKITLDAWNEYDCIDEKTMIPTRQTFSPNISIGDNTIIGSWNHITAINHISIGKGCLTGKWVTITDNSHGESKPEFMSIIPTKRRLISKGPVVIGNNVWIGDKCTILPNVTIGDGAIIGANSVVSFDIPPYSVAVGSPAKVIKSIMNTDES